MKTPGTYQEKTNEKAESINLVGFSSKPRDPIFEFIEDSFIEEENERVSKDLQKLTIVDMTADKQKKRERIKSFSKEKKVQVIQDKNRKKPQRSDAVETENMINIADDTEIIDLTKKVVDGSANGGKKEDEGGLITTWKEIRTAAGALPQKIRTIIVPLHKVNLRKPKLRIFGFYFVFLKAYNIPEKYMRGLLGKKFAATKNKKVKLRMVTM